MDGLLKYNEAQKTQLLRDIFDGIVTPRKLPKDLYLATANLLNAGVDKGFKPAPKLNRYKNTKVGVGFGEADKELLMELNQNIYMFSAAKTFKQVEEISEALLNDQGELSTWKEFKAQADQTFDTYNESYLKTEYDTAIAQAQSARAWNEIEKQKDTFPNLLYVASNGDATCDICSELDGTILPVDDEFWDIYTPENHFNCGCHLEQIDKYEDVQTTTDNKVEQIDQKLSGIMGAQFRMNPGKDKVIFNEKHGYFDVEPKDKGFAQENFGLPIPE